MTTRERYKGIMSFQKPDRPPIIEWAIWWDKTIDRWREEGLPGNLETSQDIMEHLGLDVHKQIWLQTIDYSKVVQLGHGEGFLEELTVECYEKIRPHILPKDVVKWAKNDMDIWKIKQQEEGALVWLTLDGFFWFPRKLMGIESHLYAFYDAPELMHRMNQDLLAFVLGTLEEFCETLTPDFVMFTEDMSYNHGPMISEELFNEFMAPYYSRLVKKTRELGIDVIVDSDGDVTKMIPWFENLGIDGILPLERQSGVDVVALREKHPKLRMIGGFDKMVMNQGEAAMRKEFQRLLPVIKQGGFVPSCDHQTPPQVSLEDYRLYVSLLKEYCLK
ncbi:MAG: hypothetical protein FWC73_13150 [Defluviitaleaceae bacterium]|nr:hypothetical protein [Defluviitaleaceae bacterium]